jgi:tripartite-type tricarboxylate transporter receptor subunit TctC
MGKSRVASLPDVPTIAEQEFPDVDVAGWFMVAGPRGLPGDKVKKLHDAFITAFNAAQVKAAMAKQDKHIAPTTPEAALA